MVVLNFYFIKTLKYPLFSIINILKTDNKVILYWKKGKMVFDKEIITVA